MRQREKKAWAGLFVMTAVLAYVGVVPARGADPGDMPAASLPAPTTQAPASSGTPAPQDQGKGGHRKAAMHRMREACGEDIKKLCQNVKPGEGRIVKCLEQHQSEVSQTCNQLLTKKESRQGKGR